MFRRVYLDNSATTPIDPRVLEAMLPFLREDFGNASSIHYFGQRAKAAVDKARHQVASLVNSRPNEIDFTSGGTESNNLAIRGVLSSGFSRPTKVGTPNHVVSSVIEHPAVKNVIEDLEKQGLVEVTWLPVYGNGIVRVDDVTKPI